MESSNLAGYIDVEEAAKRLGLGDRGRSWVTQMARDGRIRSRKIGRFVIVSEEDINAHLAHRQLGRPKKIRSDIEQPKRPRGRPRKESSDEHHPRA